MSRFEGLPETVFNETPRSKYGTQFGMAVERRAKRQPFLETAIRACPHCGGSKFETESIRGRLTIECSTCKKQIMDLRWAGEYPYSEGASLYRVL